MAIIDIFSKRKRREESLGKKDVYQYDEIPKAFRIQVVHLWRAALGRYYRESGYSGRNSPSSNLWDQIHDALAREKGVWMLGKYDSDPSQRCVDYVMSADTDGVLDIIELTFIVIDATVREFDRYNQELAHLTQDADSAIGELNHRFLEHGIGYQYVKGRIIRVDSQFLHAEAVKPALALLNESHFAGPADEFMRAFDHHRKGETKDAIDDALKAFESTMKAICDARKWARPANATAVPLIGILCKNGLIPPELESHFSGLRSAMESGLPTLANRMSRHGQGATPKEVPPHYAAYALHLVASNIVFLLESHKMKK